MRTPFALVTLLVACGGPAEAPKPAEPAPAPKPVEPAKYTDLFKPLPDLMESASNPVTAEKVELGRMLYFDKRFSKNHDISCNSCHQLDKYGVDNLPTSPGHKGQLGGRNSPTVYNAALHVAQFWDGREPDVEAQAKGPVLNPVEMAMPSADVVLSVINSIPEYQEAFKKAFPGEENPVTYDNFGKAVGAFERKLVTLAPIDQYLTGKTDALSDAQKAGMDAFVNTGCATCHMGSTFGGTMFQKIGLVTPYETTDLGRFEVTKNEAEKYFFKVPSLRNITKTGPYFHDGKVATLEEAVTLMAKHQLGKELTPDQVTSIVTFLGALEGKLPTDHIKEPTLPASTDKTPKPDPS